MVVTVGGCMKKAASLGFGEGLSFAANMVIKQQKIHMECPLESIPMELKWLLSFSHTRTKKLLKYGNFEIIL